jgi:hypothetical protein
MCRCLGDAARQVRVILPHGVSPVRAGAIPSVSKHSGPVLRTGCTPGLASGARRVGPSVPGGQPRPYGGSLCTLCELRGVPRAWRKVGAARRARPSSAGAARTLQKRTSGSEKRLILGSPISTDQELTAAYLWKILDKRERLFIYLPTSCAQSSASLRTRGSGVRISPGAPQTFIAINHLAIRSLDRHNNQFWITHLRIPIGTRHVGLSHMRRTQLTTPSVATLADQMAIIQPRRFNRREAGLISDIRGCRLYRERPNRPKSCTR